jgi:uncharacterized protein (TIGR00106 family)
MAVVEFSVVPVGTGSPSVGGWVVKAMRAVEASGIKHQLTPMSTILEGGVEETLGLVAKIHEEILASGVKRVITSIKIDDRRDKVLTMKGKVDRVQEGLKG